VSPGAAVNDQHADDGLRQNAVVRRQKPEAVAVQWIQVWEACAQQHVLAIMGLPMPANDLAYMWNMLAEHTAGLAHPSGRWDDGRLAAQTLMPEGQAEMDVRKVAQSDEPDKRDTRRSCKSSRTEVGFAATTGTSDNGQPQQKMSKTDETFTDPRSQSTSGSSRKRLSTVLKLPMAAPKTQATATKCESDGVRKTSTLSTIAQVCWHTASNRQLDGLAAPNDEDRGSSTDQRVAPLTEWMVQTHKMLVAVMRQCQWWVITTLDPWNSIKRFRFVHFCDARNYLFVQLFQACQKIWMRAKEILPAQSPWYFATRNFSDGIRKSLMNWHFKFWFWP